LKTSPQPSAVETVVAGRWDDAPESGTIIYILLPVHNRRVLTEQFVRCLQLQTYRNFRLILIDDGSSDGTSEMVGSMLPNVTVIRGKGRWWWAGSLQRGVQWLEEQHVADDSLVLMINDDLTVEPDYLARALILMKVRPNSMVLSQFGTTGGPQETGTCADLEHLTFTVAETSSEINCLATQGLFAWWRTARMVGGFHPTLLPHYLSDYEFTIRAHRMGFILETSPELLVEVNHDTTGYHKITEDRFGTFLRKFFSIKSPANPIYWSTFIVLACPARLWARHLYTLWKNSLRRIAIELVRSLKNARADRTVRL
jgi:GT2 family glycosyltransferase